MASRERIAIRFFLLPWSSRASTTLPQIFNNPARAHQSTVLGLRIDAISVEQAAARMMMWARQGQARYSCLVNVHMTMEAFDHPSFQEVVNASDLSLADGLPLVWALRLKGNRNARQVRGTELLRRICVLAERQQIRVGFLGGKPEVLFDMQTQLSKDYPKLNIALTYSPPFRELSEIERQAMFDMVIASRTQLLFVGLGCPKQERWMRDAIRHLPMPMAGVGAAFDFIAGSRREAPRAMRMVGLEWLFRFGAEPRRLWRRYVLNNPRYVLQVALGLAGNSR
jgi:N-acetylglucosaminyldiphosphoundecaprenol N-acetyl-beta-D-mannosaminyltransferase